MALDYRTDNELPKHQPFLFYPFFQDCIFKAARSPGWHKHAFNPDWFSPGWGECLPPIPRLAFGDEPPPVNSQEPRQACGLLSLTQKWSHAQTCKGISSVCNGNISTLANLNQCVLIPPSPGFLKQGEWLQLGRVNICQVSCIFFICFNCVFPESPEEGAKASYIFSLFFQLYRVPQLTTAFLCPFHSCLVPWDWFPLVVNIHSPHLKPKAAGASHLSGHGQRQGTQPACQLLAALLEEGQNSWSFASTSVQKRCFFALPALQKAGRAWGIAHLCNMHFSSLLEVWGRRGKID